MLRCAQVRKEFGEGAVRVDALRGVDLKIPRGQMCALMGPSGAAQ